MRRSIYVAAFAACVAVAGLVLPELASAAPPSTTVVVTPNDPHGWAFFDDKGNGGTGQMVVGPHVSGVGSAELAVAATNQGYAFGTTAYDGVPLSDLSDLSYWTFNPGSTTSTLAIAMNIEIDYDGSGNYDGRLVYDPYDNGGASPGFAPGWTFHDASGGLWWTYVSGSASVHPTSCPQTGSGGLPICTWSDLQTDFPNAKVLGRVLFKAGSGWTNFDGNVDDFSITENGAATVYDFEPGPQAVTFTSTPPSPAYPGSTYTAAAAGSGAAPIGYSTAGACTNSGATVTFTAVGPCTITATQAGDATHTEGSAQQVVTVVAAPVTLSGSPVSVWGTIRSGQASFTVTATSNGAPAVGVPVTVTVPSPLSWLGFPGLSCTGTTNAAGVATCSIPVFTGIVGNLSATHSYQIKSAATGGYQAGSGSGQVRYF